MKLLVTGASGFIGKNLVKGLVNEGYEIRCLVREKSKKDDLGFLKRLKVKLFYADITKKETLKNMLDNIDVVYHLAGILGDFRTPKNDYYKTHVLGTKNLLQLCKKQKFIYCSSAGVLGPVVNGDEASKLNPTNICEETKAVAEKLVLDYDNHVILRPEFVYGPYDLHVLNLFKAIKNKRFRIIGNGSTMLHPTYANDLVYCLIKCLDNKIKNEVFVIAGEKPVSVKNFTKPVANQLNVEINRIKIPLLFAQFYVLVVAPISRLFNMNPILTKPRLDFFTKTRTFNTKKAQNMLSYNPIKLEEGIKKTIEWYRQKDYL